jgi:alpha-ketoglutarate-dependent taurine dioxygenase
MQIEPIPNAPFGVRVNGLRCASVSPEEIGQLQTALHEHQLLVIPRQNELTPAEEVMFYRLIYPQAKNVWRDQTENAWERFKVDQGNLAGTYQIPDEPGVLVLGKGQINHHGLQVTLGGDRTAYGKSKGSQVLGGGGLQWHIDGPFYEHAPGLYTQMRCLEAPQSEGRWIDLANGGDPVWCAAGATAFASGRIAFDHLSAMDQSQCLGTRVHYFPRPFETTYRLGNTADGLRVADSESEACFERGAESPGQAFNDPLAQVYPLVWRCPYTGTAALMPQPRCLAFLEDAHKEPSVFLGTVESRLCVQKWMTPAVASDHVYVHPWQPGDLVIWYNHAVWHSATGSLAPDDRRVMHLTAFNDRLPPKGAVT